jgi:transcriptional regulator with XRE-family HTH domain
LTKLDKETSDALAAKVGKNIRSAQRSGGVSTEQIAADTGIDVERIEVLIAGTATDEPLPSELWLIAGSLKVELGDFFDGIRWIPDWAGSGRYEIDE